MKNLKTDLNNGFESEGYNDIMFDVRLSNDPYDPWGSNIGWLFALAEILYVEHGVLLPDYKPSSMVECGAGYDAEQVEEFDHELYSLYYNNASASVEDMRRVYEVLGRRDDILKMLGKSY